MTTTTEQEAQLLDEYSQSLDTSTILAILSDYDISNLEELSIARQTLEILKSSAVEEEGNGFDPSGASGFEHGNGDQESAKGDNDSHSASQRGWKSQTDDTSVNQDQYMPDIQGLNFSDRSRDNSPDQPFSSELDDLDEEGKEKALIGIFPALKPFDIKWTLKKCKGDATQAIDELMTQSFLEESGGRHRGVEAFSESEATPRSRKGKGKKKRSAWTDNTSEANSPASPSVESPSESKWDTGRQDVEFLSTRTGMPLQQASSIYHQNGGSIKASIRSIMVAYVTLNIEVDDPIIQISASELHQKFPSISTHDLETLLQVTASISNARALATALATTNNSKKNPIQLEFRHAPIQLDAEPLKLKSRPKVSAVYPDRPYELASTTESVTSYQEARNAAFAQASSAYRKGKSNHLMGGAAAYYSQIGRDLDIRLKVAESAAADALVASQSTRLELDLHGMNVKDAVRISREAVTRWWVSSTEQRAGGRSTGQVYKIVTGQGHHSEGGRGKLGPAVAKMLLAEGWQIVVGDGGNYGKILVTGVGRNRR